jgi:hypothetical protein
LSEEEHSFSKRTPNKCARLSLEKGLVSVLLAACKAALDDDVGAWKVFGNTGFDNESVLISFEFKLDVEL